MVQSVILVKKINKIDKVISSSKPIEFNVKKDTIKNSLDFQMTKVNGSNVLLTDKNVYNDFTWNLCKP